MQKTVKKKKEKKTALLKQDILQYWETGVMEQKSSWLVILKY